MFLRQVLQRTQAQGMQNYTGMRTLAGLGPRSSGIAFGVFVSFALAGAGTAGEYHWGATLKCAECHLPSSDDQRGWGQPPLSTLQGPTVINTLPLRKEGDALCLDCHDGRADAPDVVGQNTATHVRQAGALPTGVPPFKWTNGHDLGVTAVPPGGTTAVTLHCTTCHNPHGSEYYRNLPRVTYAKGRNDLTKDVFLRSWVEGQIAVNYSADNVDFNEPKAHGSAMAEFCQGCHRDFHTVTAFGVGWRRHPTGAANISSVPGGHSSLAAFGRRPYRVKVMSPAGDWGPRGSAWTEALSTLTPTCITCHRAHGNRNPFGLISPTGSQPITEEGDGKVPQALCGQCHVQADQRPGALKPGWQAP